MKSTNFLFLILLIVLGACAQQSRTEATLDKDTQTKTKNRTAIQTTEKPLAGASREELATIYKQLVDAPEVGVPVKKRLVLSLDA